jgi:methylated-DNA-protein-cysteine methyltransferase-like protein
MSLRSRFDRSPAGSSSAMSDWFEEVYAAARLIPPAVVLSYGQLGDRAGVTARMAGKAMTFASDAPNLDAVPWWRVLGSDGTLRIGRRDPALAKLQRDRLEAEGVRFTDAGRVESRFFAEDESTRER